MEDNKRYGIVLDGRMDEPVWETLEVHTGFRRLGSAGGQEVNQQTEFKILPCEDRVYIGIKCFVPDGMEEVERLPSIGRTMPVGAPGGF